MVLNHLVFGVGVTKVHFILNPWNVEGIFNKFLFNYYFKELMRKRIISITCILLFIFGALFLLIGKVTATGAFSGNATAYSIKGFIGIFFIIMSAFVLTLNLTITSSLEVVRVLDNRLEHIAKKSRKNELTKRGLDHLESELSKGNTGKAGIGSKHLHGTDISYLRHAHGARVFYRREGNKCVIIGECDKRSEQTVIDHLMR